MKPQTEPRAATQRLRLPSIGTRPLLVLLVALAVLPGIAVVVQGYYASARDALEQAEVELDSMAVLVAANQDGVLLGAQRLLDTVASSPSIRRLDLRPLCEEFLRNIVAATAGFNNVGLANRQGEVVCQGHTANGVVNIADRLHFRNAISTRGFSVGRHIQSRIAGQSMLGFGMPAYDDDGQLKGVVFATIDLALANRQLQELALPQRVQVHVLDVADTVLVSRGWGSISVGKPSADVGLQAAKGLAAGHAAPRLHANGEIWLDRVGEIGTEPGRTLRLVVSVRQSDVLRPAWLRLKEQLIALGLATLLGMVLAGWFAERHFVQPILRLSRRMEKAAQEPPPQPAEPDPPSANRELDFLGAEFNRTLQALRSQQEQLFKAQAIARVGFYRLDAAQQCYTFSQITGEILGLGPAQDFITVEAYTAMIHSDDQAMVLERRAQLMRDMQPLRLQFRIIRPDGELRWVEVFGVMEAVQPGPAVTYSGAIQDITESQRRRRLLDAQNQINAAIVQIGDVGDLYAEVCRIAVQVGQLRMAWIATPGSVDGVPIPIAHAGLSDTDPQRGRLMLEALEHSASALPSLARTALQQGRTMLSDDIAADAGMAPWHTLAAQRNYRAAAALPLQDEGVTVAVLVLMAGERHFFEAEDFRLLQAITGALSLALTRSRTEATARALNRRMTDFLASTSDGFVALDRQGRYVQVNQQAAALLGRPPQALIGKRYLEVYPEAEGSTFHRHYEAVMAHGQPRDFESFFPPWERWFENRVYPTAEGLSIFFQDITERKLASTRLQNQLSRTQLLGAITRAIQERQDLQGIFRVLTKSLSAQLPAALCGVALRSPGQAAQLQFQVGDGDDLAQLLSAAVGPSLALPVDSNDLARCLAGELVYEPDLSALDADLPRRLAAAGLRSAVLAPLALDGRVFGLVLVARGEVGAFSSGDCEFLHQLTEHVALAAHQARLHQDLQQAYEQLQRSQQLVLQQERLRALGQMASGVAHDINNAVSPVALYTEALLDTEPDLSERTRRYLLTIQRAIDDVSHTVARMREFSRERDPAAGLQAVQFNALVPQVLELTRARWRDMAQQAGIVIEVSSTLAPALPTVLATEGEIREALTNLIFNAVDAMPRGGRLHLGTAIQLGPDGQPEAALFVSDTGVGMDEPTRRRCLEPFYSTKGERGTGLGLAMVYGTVQRHGGRIEIDSLPGQGTTVRLLFPVQAPEPARALPPTPAPAPSLQVLLVDDDTLLLDSLGEILRGEGHQVQTAHGGQAGIEALHQAAQTGQRLDVVITDLGMPHIDGNQVASAAKSLLPATVVVMLTGWGSRMSEEQEQPAHVDLVLSKPPRLAQLRDMAREVAQILAAARPRP